MLVEKVKHNLALKIAPKNAKAILALCDDQKRLESTPVQDFVSLFVV